MPKEVSDKLIEMKCYYLPLLMDSTNEHEKKRELMLEWWTKYNDAICNKTNIHVSHVKEMVKKSNAIFRQNAELFFNYCNLKTVPISIVSAGVGDIIEEMLIQNINICLNHVKILSNFFEYNESNNLIQMKSNLIHVFNKHEALANDKEHLEFINNRTNIILMGDAEGKFYFKIDFFS